MTIQHRLSRASSAETTKDTELPQYVSADPDPAADFITATADEASTHREISFHETPAFSEDRRSQSADWRDAIDRMPQKLDGVERPLVMN